MSNNIVSIKWEEPPAGAATRMTKWGVIASELKSNPGKWAKIGENVPTGHAGPLKKRGKFEIRYISANTGYARGYVDIYARSTAGDSND